MSATKHDLISGAYSIMKISGLTVIPGAADISLALDRLENMAAEFAARNICTGYAFEDTPATTSLHNMARKYWYPYEINLASRLLSDFGKSLTPELMQSLQSGLSFLHSDTAIITPTPYPSRMPRGSGNRLNRYQKYYNDIPAPPNACATNRMYIGDIDDFVEHFDAYLKTGETVTAYVLTADAGLTIVSDSLTTPDVDYQVSAVGGSTGEDASLQVKIVATTSDARVTTRIINFELTSADVIG